MFLVLLLARTKLAGTMLGGAATIAGSFYSLSVTPRSVVGPGYEYPAGDGFGWGVGARLELPLFGSAFLAARPAYSWYYTDDYDTAGMLYRE